MLISAPGLISGIRLGRNATLFGNNCNISTSQAQFGRSSVRNIGTTGAYANIAPVTGLLLALAISLLNFGIIPQQLLNRD
jgi:hypothetical protein